MTDTTAGGECTRRSLNEVLAAELECLRPDHKLYDSTANPPIRPSCFKADEAVRAADLKRIYKTIGEWSATRRRDAADNDLPVRQNQDGDRCEGPLSALCLSGGGIRSATFNLGVLQALARINLLGKFDYLSSVSGGGYIASWLRAWMHRRGVDNVVTELGNEASSFPDPLAPEPTPVSNLRDYSNYLTPTVGLFSGDTWAAAATIVRNLLLNWLVLLPLLGAVIGVPLLFLLFIRTPDFMEQFSWWLLRAAVAIELVASFLVYFKRRFAKTEDDSQAGFIFACVLPICLAAGSLSAAGIGLKLPWADPSSGPNIDTTDLWRFCAMWCIGVPFLGWFTVEMIAKFYRPAQKWLAGTPQNAAPPSQQQVQDNAREAYPWYEGAALLVSGAVGMCLLSWLVRSWFSFLFNHPALFTVFALPILLTVYLISRVIFVGVASLSDEKPETMKPDTAAARSAPATAADKKTEPPAPVRNRIYGNDSDREWWSRLSGWVLLVIVSWTGVTGICLLGCYLPDELAGLIQHSATADATSDSSLLATAVKWVISALGGASGILAALAGSSPKTPAGAECQPGAAPKTTKRLLAITGPVFVICLIMTLSWSVKGVGEAIISHLGLLGTHPADDPSNLFKFKFDQSGNQQPLALPITLAFFGILLGLAALGLITSRFVNVNRFSLHGMYRNRLVRAYLGASNCSIDGKQQRFPDPFTGFAINDNFPLHCLCDPPPGKPPRIQRPLSIINTTLNLTHGEKLAWQQRKAASFSMTPLFCGNWKEGYRNSNKYGGPDGITVGTAMTISGAAANPNMGYNSSPVLGFLMAMFNVRLGAWLGNTNIKGDSTYSHPGPKMAMTPLFAEMFGLTNSNRKYVNLSDGGHFDNLGLYEAVLRRCRHVLVSDAGRDELFTFEDLGNSIRKIRIDFGINIEFDTIQVLPNTSTSQGLCCALGRIRYSEVDGTDPKDDGLLIYFKPTLRTHAQVPYDIYSYAKSSSEFPHESTVDQWFSESQFESYRSLGCHIVNQLVNRFTTKLKCELSEQERKTLSAASLFEYFYATAREYVAAEDPNKKPAAEKTVSGNVQVKLTLLQNPPVSLNGLLQDSAGHG
jgi:hypothetical protein